MLSTLATKTDHSRLLTTMIFRFVCDGGSLRCVRWFVIAEASVASAECPLHYEFFFFFFSFSLILLLSSSFVYRVANWVFFQTFLMFELINSKT